ncbi:MAG: PEP/pyruvate-binding domain-containing protein [bacterium]
MKEMTDNPKNTGSSLLEAARKRIRREDISFEHLYHLDDGHELAVVVSHEKDHSHSQEKGYYRIVLATDIPGPLLLHWGVARRFRSEWVLPPEEIRPDGTAVFQNAAARTPFADLAGCRQLHLRMSGQEAPLGISFVLFQQVDHGQWIKDHGRNFTIPVVIPQEYRVAFGSPELATLAETIIDREVNSGSWTLMHRFNLCHDLVDQIGRDNLDGLALLFVWLRFSAIRQLAWQRNYNTKPSELSHAEDRLTQKLAERFTSAGTGERELIRLMLTTVGRGGEGQRVRDEVLTIMHRHDIKETSGHFLEEWHQKLHNNTTPDDVVICEAFLEFLQSNGNRDRFYQRLKGGGITKERLESYERPIRSHPDFMPHLKDALIHDFEYFLGVLKSVHSGTDLGIAIQAARYLFDGGMHGLMDFIWAHQADPWMPAGAMVEKITEARKNLTGRLQGGPPPQVRDMLYLDLALEDFLRVVVERTSYSRLEGNQMVDLTGLILENLILSRQDDELSAIFHQWSRLRQMPRFDREWSLRAEAALGRLSRNLSGFIDSLYRLIQPKAEFLGHAFGADTWTITLFSEEVVRGRPAFILAVLLRSLDPILRRSANLGNWQVISLNRVIGEVKAVKTLRSIQAKTFRQPTIIVSDQIDGDENIPDGATAVITPDSTDIVSHVAIRARNARVLFATCYEPEIVKRLKSLKGQVIQLKVDTCGEVMIEEHPKERIEAPSLRLPKVRAPRCQPGFTAYAIPMSDFSGQNVGSKSNNLKRLPGKVPDWISLPSSIALPYGVFEKVLDDERNIEVSGHYRQLSSRIDGEEEKADRTLLDELQRAILALNAPDELISSFRRTMEEAGLPWPATPQGAASWEDAWMCIKKVWASKWNERAYLSRRARGFSHKDLHMAVLIQRVVEAEYSFVIHTVNPLSGDRDKMYAEAVLGLGETLVGDYPGRALGFTCGKGECSPQLLSFPSKSTGLFGGGLIFRSDFSGEDLSTYAGAGLYSSIMLPPPREAVLDYAGEKLVWDDAFRNEFLATISRIGTTIERILGAPQDIEGAYSKGQYYVVQTRPQVGVEKVVASGQ